MNDDAKIPLGARAADNSTGRSSDEDAETLNLKKDELRSRHEANTEQSRYYAVSRKTLWVPWVIAFAVAIAALWTATNASKTLDAQIGRDVELRKQALQAAAERRQREEEAAERDSFISPELSVEPAQPLGNGQYWIGAHLRLSNVSKRPNRPLVISWTVSAPPSADNDKPVQLDFWNDVGGKDEEFSDIYPGQSVEFAGRTKVKTAAPTVLVHVEAFFARSGIKDAECGFNETPPAGTTLHDFVDSMTTRPKVCLHPGTAGCEKDLKQGCIMWKAERFVSLRGAGALQK
jgi:hypothetical protein